ncbi:MAG: hypothetical protein ABI706_10390 [Ilumatobacteraceae bacterium]
MTGTYAAAVHRILIGRVMAGVGALATIIGTFLPWVQSGTRRRSSYEIFSLVERLGISPSSVVGWGLRLWPVVPFLVTLAVTLAWFPRRWVTDAAALVAVLYVGGVAVAVESAPSTSLVSIEFGPDVTLVGAVVLAAGALLSAARRPAGAARLPNRQ